MEKVTGYVTGVNGNLVSARFSGSVRKNEVGFVKIGNDRLKGEVIRISGDAVSMQIYEMTNGIQVGDEVELTGELLSVELGPGLLTQVYDGLQNPLPKLAEQCGFFLERGVYLDPIPDKEWEFTPCVKPGDAVLAGDAVGSVPEGQFTHLIMAPFDLKDEGWRVKSVKEKGVYHVRSTVAVLENGAGEERDAVLAFRQEIGAELTKLLAQDTHKALDDKALAALITAALQGEDASAYAAEVASVTDALKSELAGELKAGLELRLSKKVHTGFRLCAKDGSGYIDCSDEELAEQLAPFFRELRI